MAYWCTEFYQPCAAQSSLLFIVRNLQTLLIYLLVNDPSTAFLTIDGVPSWGILTTLVGFIVIFRQNVRRLSWGWARWLATLLEQCFKRCTRRYAAAISLSC